MFTINDEKTGVARVFWKDIHHRVAKIAPELASLINNLSPEKDYPLYLIYLPYGMLKGDTESSYLPTKDGKFCKLSDDSLPPEIKNELGYGRYSSPLGIVLENYIEYFIEFDGEAIPYDVAGPGRVFNRSILLNRQLTRNYSPNGILMASSGARTNFLLPSINSYNNIIKLSHTIGTKITPPQKISDHWFIFKTILASEICKSDWRTCLLYFSENWITSLSQDPSWIQLKLYILENDRQLHQYDSNYIFYEIFYSYIQRKKNLKITNPYITNTAIHLIKIALGEIPGYVPATNQNLLPLSEIQNVFCDFYDLEHYPTLMIPHIYNFEVEESPIYYSLQHPTMPSFSIKKSNRISANNELKALDYILPSFIEAMSNPQSMLSNTIFSKLANKIELAYFHNVPCGNEKIRNSAELLNLDPRFCNSASEQKFCHEGKFLRGCIQITAT